MSSPLLISGLIEDPVNQIADLLILRATDAEANVSVDDIDLSTANIAIYNNRPETSAVAGDISGLAEVEWPIQIHVIGLAELDDNDADSDVIADPLYTIAEQLFDRITNTAGLTPQQSLLTFADNYTIDLGQPVKLYDKILTGVTLGFSVYYSRGIKCY